MQEMTITYPNGTMLQAIVLSHEDREIRAAAAGYDDVLLFTSIDGSWISEAKEPVTIEFEWQRQGEKFSLSEDDYVCPKELAASLISTLLDGCERDEVGENTVYVFSPEGSRVAIRRTELRLM